MITLSDNNLYAMKSFLVNTDTGSVQANYSVTNPAATAAGYPPLFITLEMGAMPAIQATFANPTTTTLPLFLAYEEWLVSDHTLDGQDHLQFLTGGTIS